MTGEWPIKVVRLETQAAPPNRSAWLLSPAVFLFAAAATFCLFYLRTGAAEATSSRGGPLLDPRAASIQLRVETQSSGLMLSWNRYSPAVQAASDGLLRIDDGSDHRELLLDRNQILNGSVFYRPASQDVSFRLDLRGAHGLDVAQGLRVLDAQPRGSAIDEGQARDAFKNDALAQLLRSDPQPAAGLNFDAKRRERWSEPKRIAAAQPDPHRVIGIATGKPAELQTTRPDSIVQTSELGPPAAPKSTAPLPEATVLSRLLSSANPEPVKPQPASSQPATVPNAHDPVSSAANSGAPLVPSSPAPSYVPPRPLKWVKVDETSLGVAKVAQGVDVKVKIKIDEAGNVTSAHPLIDGPKRDKKLMTAAASAIKQWKFEPAKAHGTNVASEETIVLHLGPEAQ